MDEDVGALDRTSYSKTAPTYASNVRRASSLAAARLLQLATDLAPISDSSSVVDVGAGAGAMALTVASQNPLTRITAVDNFCFYASEDQHARASKYHNSCLGRSSFRSKGSHSHVFSTFILQSIPTTFEGCPRNTRSPGNPSALSESLSGHSETTPWRFGKRPACKSIDPDYQLPPQFVDLNAEGTGVSP